MLTSQCLPSRIPPITSGLTATTAALAALHKVRETGKGESIDIAMYEVMLRIGQYFMMDYFNGGEMCPRMSKGKDPYYAGCGLYKCADGYIVMELVGITQIEECFKDIGLAHLLGTPEIPEGTQLIHRIECPYGPLVEEKLDAWLATHTIAEVKERFAELNIACAKVLTRAGTGKQSTVCGSRINHSVANDGWSHLQRAEHHAEIQK
ncbi:CoA transferase [Escherichia coli]